MRSIPALIVCFCFVTSASADLGQSLLVVHLDEGLQTDTEVLRYDGLTGDFENVFIDIPTGAIGDLLYGPNGNLYAQAGHDGFGWIQQYDGQTGAYMSEVQMGPGGGSSVYWTFGPDGNMYGTGGTAGTGRVFRFDPSSGNYLGDFVSSGSGGLSFARGLDFGPDGNLYVSSRNTAQVLRYNGTTGAFMGVFATTTGSPQDLLFGPDGALWVVTMADRVERYNGTTGAFLSNVNICEEQCVTDGSSLVFSPDNNYLYASLPLTNSVRQVSVASGLDLGDFVAPESGGLAFPVGMVFFPVPEPATISFFAISLVTVLRMRRR